VTCHCDSTIAMPILVTALLEDRELIARRRKPQFDVSGPKLAFQLPWDSRS